MEQKEEKKDNRNEWILVVAVIDRCLFLLFGGVTLLILLTICIVATESVDVGDIVPELKRGVTLEVQPVSINDKR